MENYSSVLEKCALFGGINRADLTAMLTCLNVSVRNVRKGDFVFIEGDPPKRVGVVLSGTLHIVRDDFYGNRRLLTVVEPTELFGEAFACAEADALPVCAFATIDSVVLLADYARIVKSCTNACEFHSRLIQNMLNILANKNIMLTQKLKHVTERTTREKLLSYLAETAKTARSNKFSIQLNRQELADYLAVERSAMSGELSRMAADGLLRYHRNEFELLDKVVEEKE
jgi:CRP-like cAMP-binding protein